MKSRLFHLALVIAAYCFLLHSVHAQKKDRLFDLVDQAEGLQGKKRYEEALKILDEVIAIDPKIAIARYKRIEMLLELKRYEALEKECKHFIDFFSYHYLAKDVYVVYADILYKKGEEGNSLDLLAKGAALYPKEVFFPIKIATLYMNKLDGNETAKNELQKAISINPNSAEAHFFLSDIAFREGNRAALLLSLCRILSMGIESSTAYRKYMIKLESLIRAEAVNDRLKNFIYDLSNPKPYYRSTSHENHFPGLEALLKQGKLIDLSENNPNVQFEFQQYLTEVILLLKRDQSTGKGFFWDHYASYFIDVYEHGHIQGLTMALLAHTPDGNIRKGFSANNTVVVDFNDWTDDYFMSDK